MTNSIDIVLINPGDRKQVYQNLGLELAAIEPPFWIAMTASYLRNNGINAAVIDANAENFSPADTAAIVQQIKPLMCAIIVYGSNPSASTQNMTIAGSICRAVRETGVLTAIGGLHPSALPRKTIEEEDVDFVIEGEGPLSLLQLASKVRTGARDYTAVAGLWFRQGDRIEHTARAPLIKNLDTVLSQGAWDLLPMEKYRAHNWHCFDNIDNRTPYGAIYTSLGCPYSCLFCCINAPFGKPGIRYRSPRSVVDEIGVLVKNYRIKNLKIVDELFILNENHYMAIVDMIIREGYDLNMWAYARIDTIKPGRLGLMKKAGINWLGLGIESANPQVRDGADKRMRVSDIRAVVKMIQDAGICVGANYIFGLPDDSYDTMRETLDMALELNTEWANFYCAMAYPGSKLYEKAAANHWPLPRQWHGYSQHSYDMLPLPTKHVNAQGVLRFRDEAFHEYFENPAYLRMIESKFSPKAAEHIRDMTKTRLRRRLLEE